MLFIYSRQQPEGVLLVVIFQKPLPTLLFLRRWIFIVWLFIEACVGLCAKDTYANGIEAATPLQLQDFVLDLCERLRAVWRNLDGADPRTHAQKLATSTRLSSNVRPPFFITLHVRLLAGFLVAHWGLLADWPTRLSCPVSRLSRHQFTPAHF